MEENTNEPEIIISEEVKRLLQDIDFTKKRRGEIIFDSVTVEDLCDEVILNTFVKEDKKEGFILSLLANEVSIGFRVKTVVVGFIIKNYPSKYLGEIEQTKLSQAFEKIVSLRNHAAHRKTGYDKYNIPFLKHIKATATDDKSKPIYFDGDEWFDFQESVNTAMSYMIKYLRLPKV